MKRKSLDVRIYKTVYIYTAFGIPMYKNRINRNRFQPSNFSFGAVCKIFFRMKILGSPHVAGFYGARRSQNVL